MARSGQIIESPPTRQRIEFLQTAADTGGELLALRVTVGPGGRVPGHVHLEQEERFAVEEGRPTFRVDGDKVEAGPGDRLTVPPSTPHLFRNDSDADVVMVAELRPALRAEEVFETLYRLARDGHTHGRIGAPGPLRTARLIKDYEREFFYLSSLPVGLQRGLKLVAR